MKIANIDRESFQVPCPSSPVRCAAVASPVDNFAEITSPVRNYASPVNKGKIFYPVYKETSSPVIFQKLLLSTELE